MGADHHSGAQLDFIRRETRSDLSAEGWGRHEVEVEIPEDLFYFQGHFPGDPLLPGVVQLNDLALAEVERVFPDLGPLEGARRVKFISPLRPGDLVTLRLERGAASPRVSLTLRKGEQLCTSATLLFARLDGDR